MRKAAFFDVDGTLVKSNIVSAFAHIRLQELSAIAKAFWVPLFLLKAGLYLAVDAVDRSAFNRIFYRNYRGRPTSSASEMGKLCFEGYLLPRIFDEAAGHVASLKQDGFEIVLVTGSLDFLVAPLAQKFDADRIIASLLKDENGHFTGELISEPLSGEEKAKQIRQYAEQNDISLDASHAYGDSIADLPMLECVKFPHAVSPDQRLEKIAKQNEWPVLDWGIGS